MKLCETDLFLLAELNRPKRLIFKRDLSPIDNLKTIFREIRDYFAGNVTGITRDEKIAQNIMRLLFCRIFDEKNKRNEEIMDLARRPEVSDAELYKRVTKFFEIVKNKYPDIFDADEKLEIPPSDLSYVISKLENFSLFNANRDVIGDAFEELIGTAFRGGEGQFFTPRNIVAMMINILQPSPNERIIDPACGSGGFLAHILRFFLNQNAKKHFLYGIDKDLFLSKLAKIYLTIVGEEEYHIFCENSLEEPSKWKPETQQEIKFNSFDCILTNPPFGAKIPVVGISLLKQYELGHQWINANQKWTITNLVREKQAPQILFIERVIQLLKYGGRAGIVLPEGIFGNPSNRYIWEYIKKHASIIGIVSLSQETFQPSTHTKTSVLFIEKKINSRKQIFMAIANAVGHNKNGKEIYKINNDGSFILDKYGNKIIDDDTPTIAENFKNFLATNACSENYLGFTVAISDIKDNIFIPENYSPELKQKMIFFEKSGKFKLKKIGELVEDGILQIKRGNEIGSQFYGSGNVPFIRTTDIVNWEIKIDPIKCVSEEIYEKYKDIQDVKREDILFVNDGTFLIGRSAMVTDLDEKCVIQSHIKKIRLLKNGELTPYYLFYLLNTKFVQQQIEKQTFVQATLSTLGNRIMELVLPISTNKEEIISISKTVKKVIESKRLLRQKVLKLLEQSV